MRAQVNWAASKPSSKPSHLGKLHLALCSVTWDFSLSSTLRKSHVAQLLEQQHAGKCVGTVQGRRDIGRLCKSSPSPSKAVVGVAQLVRQQHAAQHAGTAQPRQAIWN